MTNNFRWINNNYVYTCIQYRANPCTCVSFILSNWIFRSLNKNPNKFTFLSPWVSRILILNWIEYTFCLAICSKFKFSVLSGPHKKYSALWNNIWKLYMKCIIPPNKTAGKKRICNIYVCEDSWWYVSCLLVSLLIIWRECL